MQGLHWGVAALQEDDDMAAKKEKIVQAFAVNPIEFLSGKVMLSACVSIILSVPHVLLPTGIEH